MLFFLLLAILLIWTENKSICHIEKKLVYRLSNIILMEKLSKDKVWEFISFFW